MEEPCCKEYGYYVFYFWTDKNNAPGVLNNVDDYPKWFKTKKKAAREFRELTQCTEILHPSYGEVDEDKLLEDYFLAGALWYRETLKEKVMAKKTL